MHQGLPVSVSIELVGWGSSELEFGASVNSTVLTWVSEKSPSSSWMSSYVPSTSGLTSIWNAKVENIVRCLSIAFLHYRVNSV